MTISYYAVVVLLVTGRPTVAQASVTISCSTLPGPYKRPAVETVSCANLVNPVFGRSAESRSVSYQMRPALSHANPSKVRRE